MELLDEYDVVVVGGGAAGLAGATTLARQLRSVLVIGHGDPRNAPSPGVHAYLSRDGIPPHELLAIGRDELLGYGGHLLNAEVTGVTGACGAFTVTTAEGQRVRARRVLVTTGLTDELPAIAGIAELWGRDIVHCPYCHGYEVRGQAIGVLVTHPLALHSVALFRQLSDDVTVFLNDSLTLDKSQAEALAARDVAVVDGAVRSLAINDGRLTAVVLADGRVVPRTALVVGARVSANSAVLASLGLEAVEHELGGTYVPADANGLTAVPGVWVAGNVANPMLQVGGAATAGVWSAAMINADLIGEETRLAVEALRAQRGVGVTEMFDEAYWDERYSGGRHWSGNPNATLVSVVAKLTPGTALDVGAGEGGDAIWLARNGWTVTALDISRNALRLAAAHAEEAAPDVASRITWVHRDLSVDSPTPGSFDLVTAHYIHLPPTQRGVVLRAMAAAVAPGGTLLVVAHHPSDLETVPRPPTPELFYLGSDVLADIGAGWEVVQNEARPRTVIHPEKGGEVTIHDMLVEARRTAG